MRKWLRYSRARLWLRQAEGWLRFWMMRCGVWSHVKACEVVRKHIVPVGVGLGLVDPSEGLEEVRRVEGNEEGWKEWGRERTFLGADKEHPEGMYAKGGADMVCMTEDEYRDWYG